MVDFSIDPAFQAKLDWMKDFVRDKVYPLEYLYDYDKDAPYDIQNKPLRKLIRRLQRDVQEQGMWAAHLPAHLGGQGFGAVKLTYINEQFGTSAFGPVIFGCQGPDSGNSEILAMFGSDEQKERYLKPLLSNDIFSCYAMTEPQGGSDPTNLRTTAVREGDEWVINGDKWFASSANHSAFLIVMAVTNPEEAAHNRATMFIVPSDTPGFEIVRSIGLFSDGYRSGGHPWIRFNNVRVPDSQRLGPIGQGFKVAQSRLGGGRLHHAQRTIGRVKQMIDMMAERALSRESYGEVIANRQAVQMDIANSYVEYQQFRLLVLYTAWMFDARQEHGREGRKMISAVKAAMSKIAQDVTLRALHLHGSIGLSNEMQFARHLVIALHEGVADGVTELHLANVAKQLLRGYRPAEGDFPSDVLFRRKAWAAKQIEPLLKECGVTLEEGRADPELNPPLEVRRGNPRAHN
ncbi:acyl-CoA dehydrogenase family protein [Terricaulis sp.]|uniref:acyl-CoA dehydrogenase family protein n=1 Tax=Terricaulis sp. TaxID=2768686 RepID=UPI00378456E9